VWAGASSASRHREVLAERAVFHDAEAEDIPPAEKKLGRVPGGPPANAAGLRE